MHQLNRVMKAAAVAATGLALVAPAAAQAHDRRAESAVVGGLIGALAGGLIGGDATGAVVGAGAGALLGVAATSRGRDEAYGRYDGYRGGYGVDGGGYGDRRGYDGDGYGYARPATYTPFSYGCGRGYGEHRTDRRYAGYGR